MTTQLHWLVGVLVTAFVEAELLAWSPSLQRAVLRAASMRFRSLTLRTRYFEEWCGELAQIPPGPVTRLLFALSIFARARAVEEARVEMLPPALRSLNPWVLRAEAHLDELQAVESAARLAAKHESRAACPESQVWRHVTALGWQRRIRQRTGQPPLSGAPGKWLGRLDHYRLRLWTQSPMNTREFLVAALRAVPFADYGRAGPVTAGPQLSAQDVASTWGVAVPKHAGRVLRVDTFWGGYAVRLADARRIARIPRLGLAHWARTHRCLVVTAQGRRFVVPDRST